MSPVDPLRAHIAISPRPDKEELKKNRSKNNRPDKISTGPEAAAGKAAGQKNRASKKQGE